MIHLCLSDILKLKRLPLGELGYFYGGLSGKSKEDFVNGNGRFIPYMNVFSNLSVDMNNLGCVKVAEGERQNKVEYGDVLFTGSSETPDECGMSSVMLEMTEDAPVYLNSFCFGFRFNDLSQIYPAFLKHLFRSNKIRKEISKTANGVTRFNISKKLFAKIQIPVPSIEQQKVIADNLDAFSILISNLDEEIELRKQQYEFCHISIFSGEDFDYVKIAEIAKEVFAGATPSTKVSEFWDNGDIPWMSSGEVHQGEIKNVEKKITQLGYNSSSTKMVPLNSIVIALAGQGKTRGSVGITRTRLCTNQSLCAVVPNNDLIDSDYLYHYLRSQYYELRRISSGDGTRGGLNLQMIKNFEVPLPSLEKQRTIVDKLEVFTSLIFNLQEERDLRQKQYEYYREKLLTFE